MAGLKNTFGVRSSDAHLIGLPTSATRVEVAEPHGPHFA